MKLINYIHVEQIIIEKEMSAKIVDLYSAQIIDDWFCEYYLQHGNGD